MKRYGFTLIELLIVVAIIAILAAIAVPNFLEAQTRAKVSRTVSDMRALDIALNEYQIDHNRSMTTLTGFGSPTDLNGPSLINPQLTRLYGNAWVSYRFLRLTTPISYITTVFPDVFAKDGKAKIVGGGTNSHYDSFDYIDHKVHQDLKRAKPWGEGGLTSGGAWRIASCGPDNVQAYGGSTASGGGLTNKYGVDYDASNGTISLGDIVRVGGVAGWAAGMEPAIDRVHNVYYDKTL